jgi:hypothetical protein
VSSRCELVGLSTVSGVSGVVIFVLSFVFLELLEKGDS